MDSFRCIAEFDFFIEEIRSVIKPEFYPQLDELKSIDPHDLVSPETWYPNESAASSYVWSMFLKRAGIVQSQEAGKH